MDIPKEASFLELLQPSEIRPEEDLERITGPWRPRSRRGVAPGDVPLLIKALKVHREGVDRQARRNLGLLFGHDLGGRPEPWAGWWRQHLGPQGKLVRCWDRHCALAT